MHTGNETVVIDPQLLLQRLVAAGTLRGELNKVFSYELCSYPPALFETTDILLSASKSTLVDAMWNQVPNTPSLPPNVQYVFDGGALLHRIPWHTSETYDGICSR